MFGERPSCATRHMNVASISRDHKNRLSSEDIWKPSDRDLLEHHEYERATRLS